MAENNNAVPLIQPADYIQYVNPREAILPVPHYVQRRTETNRLITANDRHNDLEAEILRMRNDLSRLHLRGINTQSEIRDLLILPSLGLQDHQLLYTLRQKLRDCDQEKMAVGNLLEKKVVSYYSALVFDYAI